MISQEQAVEYAGSRKQERENFHDQSAQVADLTRLKKRMELSVASEVADEQDGAGKAKYSNADRRAAETESRLSAMEEYVAITANLMAHESMAAQAQIEADYHRDLVRIYCAGKEQD